MSSPSPKEFGEFDFAAGSINGLRAFKVDALGRLTGVSHRAVWTPGENVAECNSGNRAAYAQLYRSVTGLPAPTQVYLASMGEPRSPEHLVPEKACECGFWAYYNGENAFSDASTVTAIIEGYGRTIVGTKGFRCERAQIKALVLSSPVKVLVEASTVKPLWRDAWLPAVAYLAALFGAIRLLAEPGWSTVLALAISLLWAALLTGQAATERKRRRHNAELLALKQAVTGWAGSTPDAPTADRLRRLRENYPDVPVYSSLAKALKDFPVDAAAAPSPQSDPNFWTRSAS